MSVALIALGKCPARLLLCFLCWTRSSPTRQCAAGQFRHMLLHAWRRIRNWYLDSQDGIVVTSGLRCGAPVANLYDVSGGGVSGCTVAVNQAYTGSNAAAQFSMTVDGKTATVSFLSPMCKNLHFCCVYRTWQRSLVIPHVTQTSPVRLAGPDIQPKAPQCCRLSPHLDHYEICMSTVVMLNQAGL